MTARPGSAAAPSSIFGDERAWLARILIVTALVYSPNLRNEFVLDDHFQIENNRFIGDWSFIWKSLVHDEWWYRGPLYPSPYYRPLFNVWLWLNFRLFGLHPAGWHAAMIALHLLVVWLVFRVTTRLAADRWTAVLAAALFALMPTHAEAVAWLSAAGWPLAAAFELGAFWFYLPASPSPEEPALSLPKGRGGQGVRSGPAREQRRLALSLVLFGGALLTYESATAFPALIAAHAFLYPSPSFFAPSPSGRGQSPREVISERYELGEGAAISFATRVRAAIAAAWPYALEVAAYFGLRIWALGSVIRPNLYSHITGLELALTIPGAIMTYAVLLLMPWLASPEYHLALAESVASPAFYQPIAWLAALSGAALLLLRRHPRRRLDLFCAVWIVAALGPMLNLRSVAILDRYLYFSSVGFCVMAADLAVTFARGSARRATAVWIGAAAGLIGYAGALFNVQRIWHDDVTVSSRQIEVAPEAPAFHRELGMARLTRGDYAGARIELTTAVRLDPNPDPYVFYDLALVNQRLGDRQTAMRWMAEWLRRLPDPQPAGYAELALLADTADDSEGVEAALAIAAAMPGGAETVAVARARMRLRHGDAKGGEKALREIVRRDPDNADALAALGTALSDGRRYQEALAMLRRAAAIAPDNPDFHYRIAFALHNLGHDREARDECALALSLGGPWDPNVQALMAAIERGGAR